MAKKTPGLSKRGDQWVIQFRSRHKPGETYYERLPHGTSRKVAVEVLEQRRAEDLLGVLESKKEKREKSEQPNGWTFDNFVVELYVPHMEHRVAASTLKRYKRSLRELWAHFEGVLIQDIDKASIARFATERKAEGLRGRAVNIDLQQLQQVLNFAYDHGYLDHPPPRFKGLKLPEKDSKESDWLTPEQFEAVYETACAAGYPWPCYVVVRTYVGCRPSEGRDIQIKQLDLVNATVRFDKADTKDAQPRVVGLSDLALVHIRNQIVWLEDQLGRSVVGEDYLFQHISHSRRKGEGGRGLQRIPDYSASGRKRYPWDPEGMRVNPHMFRHTFAAWQLRGGTPIASVAAMLGHSDVKLTYKIYGHIQPKEHVQEIEKMPVPASVRLRLVGNGGEE